MRPTVMEVDVNAFKKNIEEIKKFVGNKTIMPVVKANAYGTHLNYLIDLMNEFSIISVATCDEAVNIRKNGFNNEILVLNQPSISDIDSIIDYDISVGISDLSFINELVNVKNKVKVHLEVETGMNRTGIKLNDLDSTISLIKSNNFINVLGVYTHLSSADFDSDYTNRQLDIFKNGVSKILSSFDTVKYIHSSASNGLLNYDDGISNLVRPGMIMYGYESYPGVYKKINLTPVTKLKTEIVFLKNISSGEAVSYSQKYIAKSDRVIATIPIGYADGLRRELSNVGFVVINGKKAPIVGNICMDSCMIDVTDIEDVRVGSTVYIWDNEIQKLEDISNICNTINYEILCTISNRVIRKFI